MRHMIMLAAPLALAACTTGDGYRSAQAEEAQAEVEERLARYSATGTRNCLPSRSNGGMKVYADGTILVKQGSRIYGQNLGAGCARASSAHNALVTDGTIGSMCSGTIAQVIDSTTGIFAGSCGVGDWTVYRRDGDADEAS